MSKVWSAGGDVGTYRTATNGDGTKDDALMVSGLCVSYLAGCEEYNGSAWSSGADVSTARRYHLAGGNSADGICAGGNNSAGSDQSSTEEFNGTAWGAGGNLSSGRRLIGGGGSSSDAIIYGGYMTGTRAETYEYDGTSWASGGIYPSQNMAYVDQEYLLMLSRSVDTYQRH